MGAFFAGAFSVSCSKRSCVSAGAIHRLCSTVSVRWFDTSVRLSTICGIFSRQKNDKGTLFCAARPGFIQPLVLFLLLLKRNTFNCAAAGSEGADKGLIHKEFHESPMRHRGPAQRRQVHPFQRPHQSRHCRRKLPLLHH